MIATDKPNPFCVLMLPTSSTLAEIVSQTEDLHLLVESKEGEMLLRWAAEQLRTNQRTRLEYELFELPETRYADEDWENFVRLHKRQRANSLANLQDAPPPELAELNLTALVELLLDEQLAELPMHGEPDLEQAIAGCPLVPKYTLPLQEEEVICG